MLLEPWQRGGRPLPTIGHPSEMQPPPMEAAPGRGEPMDQARGNCEGFARGVQGVQEHCGCRDPSQISGCG